MSARPVSSRVGLSGKKQKIVKTHKARYLRNDIFESLTTAFVGLLQQIFPVKVKNIEEHQAQVPSPGSPDGSF